jgi:hypothetical protein
MLKVIGVIGVLLLVAAAVVLVLAAMKPDTFRVARSTSINAASQKIFPLINDLHQFNTWNPFEKKDPGKGTYSGPRVEERSARDRQHDDRRHHRTVKGRPEARFREAV